MNSKLMPFVLAICGLLPGTAGAQSSKNKGDIRIEWGEDIPLPKKHYPYSFAGNKEDGYVQIASRGGKELSLIKIDQKLKSKGTQIHALPKSKYIVLENILEIDGRAFVLFSDYDKGINSEKLLSQEISLKDGKAVGKPETLLATKNSKVMGTNVGGGYTMVVTDKFKVVLPDTGDRFLIYYRKKPEVKNDKKNFDKLVYNVFDMDLKLIWSKEVTMPYVEAEMRIRDHAIINDEVFIFAETKSGQTFEKGKKTPEFDQLSVFKVSKDAKKIQEKELTIDKESYIKEFVVGQGFGNTMLVSGYYRPGKKTFVYTGYYTAVFDPESMGLNSVRKYPFQPELISSFESARTKRKLDKALEKGKETGIPFMVMRSILRKADGGWYLVGEQHRVTLTIDLTGRTPKYVWRFYYLDAIVSSISPEGEEEWVTKLPKNQLSVYTTYGFGMAIPPDEYYITSNYGTGMSSFIHNDNLYVFYMDNIKNKNMKESDYVSAAAFMGLKGSYLAGVKLTPDGKKTHNALYDLKDENANKMITPTTLVDMGGGTLLSASRRGVAIFAKKNNIPALIYLQ